jgi:hypothetical protein
VVEHRGNRWLDCAGATDEAISGLEPALGRKVPKPLCELLRACAGGRPERPFYCSAKHDIEVAIGRVLLVGPTRSRQQTVLGAFETLVRDSEQKGTSAADLLPFAVDNGNAHYLCLDGRGRVVYRILHEPAPDERRIVADSLDAFLEGLEEPPF